MSCVSRLFILNNGLTIPTLGLGTYKSKDNEVKEAVKYAIEIGYRHIDTAWFYENEKEIGEALADTFKEGKVKREDLYIVTKLWNNFHEKKNVIPKLKESLGNLKLDYVDLFLIHWPFGFREDSNPLPTNCSDYSDVDYLETWEGMEDCVKEGLTKSIGISNFNEVQMDKILKNCKIKPVINQVEVNPNNSQSDLIRFCKERDVVITAFCPLERIGLSSEPGYPGATVLDPKVIEIGKKYNKTAAQVVLRYLVSLGITVIPKSVTKSRILENFEIFDFNLSEEDICYLKSRNKNIRTSSMSQYKDHKHYPF